MEGNAPVAGSTLNQSLQRIVSSLLWFPGSARLPDPAQSGPGVADPPDRTTEDPSLHL